VELASELGDEAMDDLTLELYVGKVDERELAGVILQVFGHGSQESENEIACGRQGEPHAVKLLYEDNRLESIMAGPRLRPEDLEQLREKIRSELLEPSDQRVGRGVLFSSYPVTGYFEAPGFFRILPVPQEAPKPPFALGHHPFLIEFTFHGSPNFMIRAGRRYREAHRIALVLNAILEGTITDLGMRARHHWVIVSHKPGQALKYEYLQEGYGFEGLGPKRDVFSALDELEPIKHVDPQVYFSRRGLEIGRSLEIPTVMADLVRRYRYLDIKRREQFLRAAYWFRHAMVVHPYSGSASFLALINSIEALMPREKGPPLCQECKQPVGKSITQRFVEFLDTMVPGNGDVESARRSLYRVRGKLAHGGDLLREDLDPWDTPLHPERTSQGEDARHAYGLARLALVNWLANQADAS
jgi:hypothetical protein